MRWRTIVATLAGLAVIAFIIVGVGMQGMPVWGTVEYMGLGYDPSDYAVPPEEKLYYTGDTHGGAKIYVPALDRSITEKAPPMIIVRDILGYHAYSLQADRPPVYAYMPYDRYNAGETVTFGLVDDASGGVGLRNSAPYEIRKNENGEWATIYQPVAAQMIISLENGTYTEWTWDQRNSSGGWADTGDYRAVIDGKYTISFSITKGAPVVRAETTNYDPASARDTFFGMPKEHAAFNEYYKGYFGGAKSDIVGQMLLKAWAQGEDAEKLRKAIQVSSNDRDILPCLAVHARYNGRPAWFIVYNWGMWGEDLAHIQYYVIDDTSGKVVDYLSCK